MRKQQLRMDSGGAVDRAKRRELGWTSLEWSTISIFWNTCVSAAAIKGCTGGTDGRSNDWLRACPLAWHRLGCSLSMPTQSLIAWSLSTDIDTDSSICPVLKPGQAYPATASCMNSMLTSTISAAIRRDGRESFIVCNFCFVYST